MADSNERSLADIAQRILEDSLSTIIHNIVITRHREHKMMMANLDPKYRLPLCETCNLPRLLDPPLAPKLRQGAPDPTTYCDKKPWSRKPGHDIYGNPFLKSDVTGRPLTKKEREAQAQQKKEGKGDGTPASQDQEGEGTGPPSPSGDADEGNNKKLEKGEKKASKIDEKLRKGEYVPWHTCPSCKRSLLITRFAKHLEQCMGLSGRAAARNAVAKMNGTPNGSRGGTPNPTASQEGNGNGKEGGAGGDDEEDDLAVKAPTLKKKLLKKNMKEKVEKTKKEKSANGKVAKSLAAAAKRPPGSVGTGTQRSSPAPSSVGGDKRDRDELGDDDEDEIHVKKRQKLQRVGSTASILSQSTVAPEMERTDSLDGSFVDGSVADD